MAATTWSVRLIRSVPKSPARGRDRLNTCPTTVGLRASLSECCGSFGAYRLLDLDIVESGLQRVPRQRGAFHARRVIPHAAKDYQFAEFLGHRRVGGQEGVEPVEQLEGLLAGLALQTLGHERRRRGRDGATRAHETHILDDVVFHLEEQLQLVAAERIVA